MGNLSYHVVFGWNWYMSDFLMKDIFYIVMQIFDSCACYAFFYLHEFAAKFLLFLL